MSDTTHQPFNKRAFVSVLVGFSFILMAVTGGVLFFAPSCRIARETSWSFLGHSKDQLVAVHIWFSIAFSITAIFHIYLNWAAIKRYFSTKLRQGIAFRLEWVTALIICCLIYAGTIGEVAPFSSLMALEESYKHSDTEGGAGQGRHGGAFRGGTGSRPQGPATQPGGTGTRPAQGPQHSAGGIGRMTLGQFCENEGIPLDKAASRLQDKGVSAKQTMTMREIADQMGIHPRDLRALLQDE